MCVRVCVCGYRYVYTLRLFENYASILFTHGYCSRRSSDNIITFSIYTSTIKSPSAVQISKSIKQTQSVDKVYYNTRV